MGSNTLNEILSQPDVWRNVEDYVKKNLSELQDYTANLNGSSITFIGCGTSFYLAQSAASVYQRITGERGRSIPASDVIIFPENVFPESILNETAVLISRSGTTTEVLMAGAAIAEKYQFETIALSCRPGSALMEIGNRQFALEDADESSVVMTRSFTSMLLFIQWFAAIKAQDEQIMEELRKLPEVGSKVLEKYGELPKMIIEKGKYKRFIYLGQGPFFGLANESMLKIKEMSRSPSEAYHSLEFRHGPMSIIGDDMLIIFFISEQGKKEEVSLLEDMKKLGGHTLVICEKADDRIKNSADYLVEIDSGLSDYTRLITCMPITQLLGYYNALSKDLDPDNPKNLTQVVTLD